jgi:hypothetical protein
VRRALQDEVAPARAVEAIRQREPQWGGVGVGGRWACRQFAQRQRRFALRLLAVRRLQREAGAARVRRRQAQARARQEPRAGQQHAGRARAGAAIDRQPFLVEADLGPLLDTESACLHPLQQVGAEQHQAGPRRALHRGRQHMLADGKAAFAHAPVQEDGALDVFVRRQREQGLDLRAGRQRDAAAAGTLRLLIDQPAQTCTVRIGGVGVGRLRRRAVARAQMQPGGVGRGAHHRQRKQQRRWQC